MRNHTPRRFVTLFLSTHTKAPFLLFAVVVALSFCNSLHAADADYTNYPYFNETPVQRDARMKW